MSEKQRTEKLRENINQDHGKKETDTRSATRWLWVMWLAGLVLISCTLLGSQVVAQECTECGSDKSDVEPYSHVRPKCKKSDSDFKKSATCKHHPNYDYCRCDLWYSVYECCKMQHQDKCDNQQCYNNKGYTLFNEGECHYLLVPTDPVIGVEDKDNRNKHNYFNLARIVAEEGIWDVKKLKVNEHSFGLAINPATHRSQHQLHIHIGRLPRPLREKLQKQKKIKGKLIGIEHNKQWQTVKVKYTEHQVEKTCYGKAKFFKGKFPWPFSEVRNKFHEDEMKHSGIMVAGNHKNDKTYGFYIVRCKDAYVEGALNYNCPGH